MNEWTNEQMNEQMNKINEQKTNKKLNKWTKKLRNRNEQADKKWINDQKIEGKRMNKQTKNE